MALTSKIERYDSTEDTIQISTAPGRDGIVRRIADRVCVMQGGEIVEQGPPQTVLVSPKQARTRDFIADVRASVEAGAKAGKDLNAVYKETMARLAPKYGHWVIFDHCMPFDVTRCYDEVTQYPDPRIWTAERDRQMWAALES